MEGRRERLRLELRLVEAELRSDEALRLRLAAHHSITSSARASSMGGTSRLRRPLVCTAATAAALRERA